MFELSLGGEGVEPSEHQLSHLAFAAQGPYSMQSITCFCSLTCVLSKRKIEVTPDLSSYIKSVTAAADTSLGRHSQTSLFRLLALSLLQCIVLAVNPIVCG